jgi:hypothetical protein
MSPLLLLLLLVAVTAFAATASALRYKARSKKLLALASRWTMRFTVEDRFRLAPRVARGLSVPGAADVVIRDLIYRQEDTGFRYLFTVGYTVGVLRTKRRRMGAGMVVETGDTFSAVTLAPAEFSLLEQYEWLWRKFCSGAPTISSEQGDKTEKTDADAASLTLAQEQAG